ncbi:hypothetical protein L1281_001358 [Neisseria sp. HSC-16F19]|nr:hypothetical protein [Neisseria sp. HSC-16F19]MCP2040768.1 hypothetical protein [Neisseria sp. HSC-16F19]
MNQKWLAAAGLAVVLSAQTAYACTEMLPQFAFVQQNDKDGDDKLGLDEWLNADLEDFALVAGLGNAAGFAKLDRDQDGFLDATELAGIVIYYRRPCADGQSGV